MLCAKVDILVTYPITNRVIFKMCITRWRHVKGAKIISKMLKSALAQSDYQTVDDQLS